MLHEKVNETEKNNYSLEQEVVFQKPKLICLYLKIIESIHHSQF